MMFLVSVWGLILDQLYNWYKDNPVAASAARRAEGCA